MDLFSNANLSALKNINVIYPKTYEFLNNLVLWQISHLSTMPP
jgi:hypothetical protein